MRRNTATDQPVPTPAPHVSGLKVTGTAAVAAVLLGTVVGILSRQEDQGNLVRTGTPWVEQIAGLLGSGVDSG